MNDKLDIDKFYRRWLRSCLWLGLVFLALGLIYLVEAVVFVRSGESSFGVLFFSVLAVVFLERAHHIWFIEPTVIRRKWSVMKALEAEGLALQEKLKQLSQVTPVKKGKK